MIIRRSLLPSALVSLLLVSVAPAGAQVQTPGQQACAAAAEKAHQKTVKARGKEVSSCLKGIAKGATTAGSCFGRDEKGKIKKARQTILDGYARSCIGSRTDFAFAGADAVIAASDPTDARLVEILFGDDPSTALPPHNPDTTMTKCQQGVAKSAQKCTATQLKSYAKCEAAALKGGAVNAAAVAPCFGADDNGKIAHAPVHSNCFAP